MTRLLSFAAFLTAGLLTLIAVVLPAYALRPPRGELLPLILPCLLAWAALSLWGRWHDGEAVLARVAVLAFVGLFLWLVGTVGG